MYFCHILCFASCILQAYATGEDEFPRIDFVVARGDTLEDLDIHNKVQIVDRDLSSSKYTLYRLTRKKAFYLADIEVGSDKQKMSVRIDTGTSDLWLISSDVVCVDKVWFNEPYSTLEYTDNLTKRGLEDSNWLRINREKIKSSQNSHKRGDYSLLAQYGLAIYSGAIFKTDTTCTSFGSFNTGISSSYLANETESTFKVSYRDDTDAFGDWAYEDISFGGFQIKQLQLGVAKLGTAQQGVLGIGLSEYELTNLGSTPASQRFTYMNLPERLKSEGIIARNAYSIYSIEGKGSVLFGAIDKAKIDGKLTSYPVVNTRNFLYTSAPRYAIVMSELSLSASDGPSIEVASSPYAVLLDTGSTLSYFPEPVVDNIIMALNGTYDSSLGVGFVPCPSDLDVKLNLKFGKNVYSIPLASVLVKLSGKCLLGILYMSTFDNEIILGENIMKHMYVVYDSESMEVALANVKNTSDSNIVSITGAVGTKATGVSLTIFLTDTRSVSKVKTVLSYSTGTEVPTQSKTSDSSFLNISLASLFASILFAFVLML